MHPTRYSMIEKDRKVTGRDTASVGTQTGFFTTEEDEGILSPMLSGICCPTMDNIPDYEQHPHLLVSMWGCAVTFTLGICVMYTPE